MALLRICLSKETDIPAAAAVFNAALPGVLLYGFVLLTIAPGLIRGGEAPLWKTVLFLSGIGAAIAAGFYFSWRFHFNEKGK